jgi:hypothetical protein
MSFKFRKFRLKIKSLITVGITIFKLYHVLKTIYAQLPVKLTVLSIARKILIKLNLITQSLEGKTRHWDFLGKEKVNNSGDGANLSQKSYDIKTSSVSNNANSEQIIPENLLKDYSPSNQGKLKNPGNSKLKDPSSESTKVSDKEPRDGSKIKSPKKVASTSKDRTSKKKTSKKKTS